MSTTDTRPDQERIVEAADRLFNARGVQTVGMDAVRAESGVPLKRLYAAFSSKDELVIAVLRRREGTWERGIEDSAVSATTPRERLLAVYDFLDSWFRGDDFRGCGFINTFAELGGVSPEVTEVVRAQKLSFQRYVAALVDQLGAPPALAAQLALLAEGAQTTAAIDGRPEAAAHARAAAETLIDAALA